VGEAMDRELVEKIDNLVSRELFRVLDDIDDWKPDSELTQVELRIKRRIRKKILDCGNQIIGIISNDD
jgi:hypothetical protein